MLPLTMAGLGVREGAMIPLVSGYGVAPVTAVTFSLPLLRCGVVVALAGGRQAMNSMSPERTRVLMIGLDAGDPELMERWTGDGTLPHLASIRAKGVFGRLDSSARYMAGSPWPTMYTGRDVSSHGLYHDFQWRHEDMGFAAPDEHWMNLTPFWRHLEGEIDVVACDIPFTPTCSPFRGLEISGWASHDKLAPLSSYPPDLVATAQRRFGQWAVSYEGFGQGRINDLLALRREMLQNTHRSAELAEWLLTHPWRLAIVCFSAPHRGGHRLWDRSSIKGPCSEAEGAEFDGALRDVYVACDQAIGRLTAAHPDACVLVFSTHGMMVNTSRADFLDDMLVRVLAGGEGGRRPVSLSRRVGEALPDAWRRAMTMAIPAQLRNRLVTLWSAGAIDWQKTRAFCCRADLHGYVRINLKGREPLGIVEPGPEFDALCSRIAEGLSSFRDADTGEPLVEAVCRADYVFPDGPYRDRLPDLIVQWRQTPAAPHRAVSAPGFGVIHRSTPGRMPNGRSGNHRGEGFLIARGPGIPPGETITGHPHIRDLAPTVLARLGVSCTVPLTGTAIKELAPMPIVGPSVGRAGNPWPR
jgi:predicted AlkP superfamily phosphohydrolase/phosphomutase